MAALLTGIVLAAGRARRFGANKLAAPLADGEALGVRSAHNLAAVVDRVLVVVNAPAGDNARLFEAAGFATAFAADADLGMGHSLAHAVRRSADSAAWLVALADMPFVLPTTLAAIAAALREGHALVVPRCAGVNGHPVGFQAAFGAELMALRGDQGARSVLSAHAAQVYYIDTTDSGVLRDIDTPADLDSEPATGRN